MSAAFGTRLISDPLEISDEELAEVSTILNIRRGFSIAMYKDACMKRRITIRMRSTGCRDVASYCALLRQNDHELDLLQKAVTIHVSQFFRNPSVFEKLRSEVLPGFFAGCPDGRDVRFWCLGCAGGEEPFSLAMLLLEHYAAELGRLQISIRGTDIDRDTLDAARRGDYAEDRLKDLPEQYRRRYFEHQNGRSRVIPAVRDMVTFQQGDITHDDCYLESSLVFCRNTLIYFSRPDQEKILGGIAAVLQPGGILVLGKSETLVGETRRQFSAICTIERIYRRL